MLGGTCVPALWTSIQHGLWIKTRKNAITSHQIRFHPSHDRIRPVAQEIRMVDKWIRTIVAHLCISPFFFVCQALYTTKLESEKQHPQVEPVAQKTKVTKIVAIKRGDYSKTHVPQTPFLWILHQRVACHFYGRESRPCSSSLGIWPTCRQPISY